MSYNELESIFSLCLSPNFCSSCFLDRLAFPYWSSNNYVCKSKVALFKENQRVINKFAQPS